MELKTYQLKALVQLDEWVKALNDAQKKRVEILQAVPDMNLQDLPSYPAMAWNELTNKGKVPRIEGNEIIHSSDYIPREAASGEPIPHVCMKVPTGGGKTLLGVAALGRLQPEPGFVIWVVPTKAIYEQTIKAFRTREHPYRSMLNQIIGSHEKIKLLEKSDSFAKQDVEKYLCIMLLMLPSANRRKNTEFLKIFQENGNYGTFFPQEDDEVAHAKLKEANPDLECTDSGRIKQSLINTVKIIRPLVILDEAHKAYGTTDESSREFVSSINRLNPRFVIELSATPKIGISNLLVNVSGVELHQEEMIKLPIEVCSLGDSDWQHTLSAANEKMIELAQDASQLFTAEGRYIRPIAVVRVQQTGRGQQKQGRIHAEDARDYLASKLAIPEQYIRVQSAERKELAGEELLSDKSQVRWIITKDALKEGWDCAFAYVLVLLDNTKALTALTQMIGRVMRQPDALQVNKEANPLNRCYIFSYNQEVEKVVQKIKGGLEREGLTGLGSFVQGQSNGKDELPETVLIKRRKKYDDLDVFLPLVLHRHGRRHRPLDYERDILSAIDWNQVDAGDPITLGSNVMAQTTSISVTLDKTEEIESNYVSQDTHLTLDYFTRRLTQVPNAWQAARIASDYLQKHQKKYETEKLMKHRLDLSEVMRKRINQDIDIKAEKVFKHKVNTKEIRFHLQANMQLNYKLQRFFQVLMPESARSLQGKAGKSIQRSLFNIEYESDFNGLEKDFALYLDESDAISWWHRIAAKQGYFLQGWRSNRVYPDFIVCRNDNTLLILETKGTHLKGNEDTEYKLKLMETLENAVRNATELGQVTCKVGNNKTRTFRMLFEDEWESQINDLLSPAK